MFFGFQLTCGLMMVFYGYSVMNTPARGATRAAAPSSPNILKNTAARTGCSSSRQAA